MVEFLPSFISAKELSDISEIRNDSGFSTIASERIAIEIFLWFPGFDPSGKPS